MKQPTSTADLIVMRTVEEIDNKATGAKMRLIRKESGKTVTSVAAILGVSKAFLSDLELGRRNWTDGRAVDFYLACQPAKPARKTR